MRSGSPSAVSSACVTWSPQKLGVLVPAPKDLFGHRVRPLAGTELEFALPVQLHELVNHGQRGGVARGDQLGPDAEAVHRRCRGDELSDLVFVEVARDDDLDRRAGPR